MLELTGCCVLKQSLIGLAVQVRALTNLEQALVAKVWEAAVQAAASQAQQATTVSKALQATVESKACRRIHLQSASTSWYTPPYIVKLVKQVFSQGIIGLDPCSSTEAQQYVQAGKFLTCTDQGLHADWFGRVYVNPPFGAQGNCSMQAQFFNKALLEYHANRALEAVVLLKAAIGYKWFEAIFAVPHAFFRTRIAFHQASGTNDEPQACGNNPHGSVAVYLGPNVDKFCETFKEVAFIPGTNAWVHSGV